MNWWTRLRRAWWAGVYVWRDPGVVERTVTLDQITYERVVWGGYGVLIRGWPNYAEPGDVARFALVTEHLDPLAVRRARGLTHL